MSFAGEVVGLVKATLVLALWCGPVVQAVDLGFRGCRFRQHPSFLLALHSLGGGGGVS